METLLFEIHVFTYFINITFIRVAQRGLSCYNRTGRLPVQIPQGCQSVIVNQPTHVASRGLRIECEIKNRVISIRLVSLSPRQWSNVGSAEAKQQLQKMFCSWFRVFRIISTCILQLKPIGFPQLHKWCIFKRELVALYIAKYNS